MDQYHRLEKLMEEKSFADLSKSDQAWVEQYITSADYDHQRLTLLSLQNQLSQTPLPPKQMEDQLMQAFRKHHASPVSVSSKFLNPLIGIAAMLIIFMLGRWSTTPSPTFPKIETVTIYETKLDTIYIGKKTTVPQTIIKEKVIRDTVYILEKTQLPIATNIPELMPILELTPPKKNSSKVKDDQQIYDILVNVY